MDSLVLRRFSEYVLGVVEKPHEAMGGMPVCPFAKWARVRNRTKILIHPFNLSHCRQWTFLTAEIEEFCDQSSHDVLTIVSPDSLPVTEMPKIVDALNGLVPSGFSCFSDHPLKPFSVGGLPVPRPPYPFLQVISKSLEKWATDVLMGTKYYDRWDERSLRDVGFFYGPTTGGRS